MITLSPQFGAAQTLHIANEFSFDLSGIIDRYIQAYNLAQLKVTVVICALDVYFS